MQGELAYGQPGTANPDRTRSLFGQAMGVAAITAGCFTLAAYLNRGGSSAGAQAGYIFAYACLVAMKFTVRRTTAGATASTASATWSKSPRPTKLRRIWRSSAATF